MRLRSVCSALLILFSALTPSLAGAQAVTLSWDTCTGPIDKVPVPGTMISLFASVLGHSAPHQGYRVEVVLGTNLEDSIRDAWRFDAGGCQPSGSVVINHINNAFVAKTCPTFQGALTSTQFKDFTYDGSTGNGRLVLANSYPAGNTTQVNPAQRYFLARFDFDHSLSVNGAGTPGVSCGGLDAAVCFLLYPASYVTTAGDEVPWALAREYATTNDSGGGKGGVCFAVPAAASTWDSIKSQYRR